MALSLRDKESNAGAKVVLVPPSLPQRIFPLFLENEFQKRLDLVRGNDI